MLNRVHSEAVKSISKPDCWELLPSDIIMGELLGEGAFGEVYKGFLTGKLENAKVNRTKANIVVAVKILKDNARGNDKKDFLCEIEMMKKVCTSTCPNIVAMLGCVTTKEPLCLVTEYVSHGDLLSYLRTMRKMYISGSVQKEEDPYQELGQILPADLTSFAFQIAKGMAHLSSMSIVHRDLACRNILLHQGKLLKISDFGLSRETREIYTQKSRGRVPYKWMAIESILAQEFTSASDVWSFGVVLWEIGTLGGSPYPGIMNRELLTLLKSGYRMEKPDNCSSEIYEVMLSCWHASVSERPTFTALQAIFELMLMSEGDNAYIDFSINPELQYYKEEVEGKESSGTEDRTESEPVRIEITGSATDTAENSLMEQKSPLLPHFVVRNSSISSFDILSCNSAVNDEAEVSIAHEEQRYVDNPGVVPKSMSEPL